MKQSVIYFLLIITVFSCSSSQELGIKHTPGHFLLNENGVIVQKGYRSGEESLDVKISAKSLESLEGKVLTKLSNEVIKGVLIYEASKLDSNRFELNNLIGKTDTAGDFKIAIKPGQWIVFSYTSFIPYILEIQNR